MTLPLFALKSYQRETLASLRRYLEKSVELGDADAAFYALTRRPFGPAPNMPGLPYVCLRVPTGGGKTVLAAHAVAVAADAFLRTDSPTVLWLVPSQAIREQTLATLQDRSNPNRRALADRFGENVRVMGIGEALYAKRADYDGGACIVVATLQAFRVEETEGRKVYEANGELMDHFSGLPQALRDVLETGPGGDPVPSLANVLRLRRPMVVVDEAHNARTPLSFDTLGRLKPSLIVEFTATPVTASEHDPAKGLFASNVLHHVSAAELKVADMIKLPVILRGRPDPKDTISEAIRWLDRLTGMAGEEEADSGEFIRPLMLIQAEPKSKLKPTLHAEEVRKLLTEDFRVPPDQVALATGETRELDKVKLSARDCPIRFIVTQQALKEGWDCSFAYVLCSVAEQKSPRAVEQLLGRVLRLPQAMRKRREDLNRAYAFATTTAFREAAVALQDGLVANGFEEIEAKALVQVVQDPLPDMHTGGTVYGFEEPLPSDFDAGAFGDKIEAATGGRVRIDPETGTLKARGTLTDKDRKSLLLALPQSMAKTVEALVHKTRGARLTPPQESADAIRFAVPRLGVRRGNALELFDRAHYLDIPWKLEHCDAAAVLNHFAPPRPGTEEARIDVSAAGRVTLEFVDDLRRQLALALEEKGWTRAGLINWLDRRLPNRRDVTATSSRLFIAHALDAIEAQMRLGTDALARAKYRVLDALGKTIAGYRDTRERTAYQAALFPQGGLEIETSSAVELVFEENGYSYNQPYRGAVQFKKHLFRVVGDLESEGEEHACAVHIDRLPAVKTWVRNTVRQPNSFWLQTASDRFHPDFVALLNDGRFLAVEYKGAHLWKDAEDDRLIGDLWAERSGGKCLFLMLKDREFERIDRAIQEGK